MASNQQTTITVTISDSGDGVSGGVTQTWTLTGANGGSLRTNLTSGRAQLQPDSGVTFTTALIIPDPTNANGMTWDAAGTVGGALSPNTPSLISFPATQSIYINAAGTINNLRVYFR